VTRIIWGPVLEAAEDIVYSYDTGVTLRQLHYQLVSRPELGYPNTQNAYKQLSSRTAEKRRSGDFPRLVDQNRRIHKPGCFTSPREAVSWLSLQPHRTQIAATVLLSIGYGGSTCGHSKSSRA
jgi:hypothetical protein